MDRFTSKSEVSCDGCALGRLVAFCDGCALGRLVALSPHVIYCRFQRAHSSKAPAMKRAADGDSVEAKRGRSAEQEHFFSFRSVVLAEMAAFEPGRSFKWRQAEAHPPSLRFTSRLTHSTTAIPPLERRPWPECARLQYTTSRG